jgi:predicted nucleic acid-binding protein
MRTAIDSSALWSLFKGEADAKAWVQLLAAARSESTLIVCDIVFAEIASLFRSRKELEARLESLGVEFDPIQPATAFAAGEIFKKYRSQGGPRLHLVPDFLIGAHAVIQADRLAARDRGYLRRYFPNLPILAPATLPSNL